MDRDLSALTGDMDVTVQGDIDTVDGLDNLSAALKRRFQTPYGSLFYDPAYGNKVFQRLSQPMGRSFEQDVAADARDCLLQDRRVMSVAVAVNLIQESRTVVFRIKYETSSGSGSFEEEMRLLV